MTPAMLGHLNPDTPQQDDDAGTHADLLALSTMQAG